MRVKIVFVQYQSGDARNPTKLVVEKKHDKQRDGVALA